MMANMGATLPEESERDWEALLSEVKQSLEKVRDHNHVPSSRKSDKTWKL